MNLAELEQIFKSKKFHPVLLGVPEFEVLDLSKSEGLHLSKTDYALGKFNERRPQMYMTDLFQTGSGAPRNIHMGLDLGSPAGTPVFALQEGLVFCRTYHSALGDYGGTIITEHFISGVKFWALYGHLSIESLLDWQPGDAVKAGDQLGCLGTPEQNGGWKPHLHLQISLHEPRNCDLPGAVSAEDHSQALKVYIDPRWIVGPLY